MTLYTFPSEEDVGAEIRFDRDAEAIGPCNLRFEVNLENGEPAPTGDLWIGGLAAIDEETVTILRRGPIELSEGVASLEKMPPGALSVLAVSHDLAAVTMLMVGVDCSAGPLEITLEEGLVIEGRVIDLDGEGADEATLIVRVLATELRLPVAEDGSFEIVLPRSVAVVLQSLGSGLASSEETFHPLQYDAQAEMPMILRLEPASPVRVELRHADGTPVQGATVSLSGPNRRATSVTDQTGSAVFGQVERGNHELELSFRGFESRSTILLGEPETVDAETLIEVEMPRLGVIMGRAIDEQGESAGSLFVSAIPKGSPDGVLPIVGPAELVVDLSDQTGSFIEGFEDDPLALLIGAMSRTDQEGVFGFVLPQGRWALTAKGMGDARASVEIDAIAGKLIEGVELLLQDEVSAMGLVRRADGSPVAGQSLACRIDGLETNEEDLSGSFVRHVTSGRDGRFSVGGVPGGTLSVFCSPDHPSRALLEGGRIEVGGPVAELVVGSRPTLRGRVMREDRSPVDRFEIMMPEGSRSSWEMVLSPDGSFSIPASNGCSDQHCRILVRVEETYDQGFDAEVDWSKEEALLDPFVVKDDGVYITGRVDLNGLDIQANPVWILSSQASFADTGWLADNLSTMDRAPKGSLVRVDSGGAFRLGPLEPPRWWGSLLVYVIRQGVAAQEIRVEIDGPLTDLGVRPLPTRGVAPSVHRRSADAAPSPAPQTGAPSSEPRAREAAVPAEGRHGHPVRGRIHGREFRVEQAIVSGRRLKLRQGEDFFADRELEVWLREEIEGGESVVVTPDTGIRAPTVWLKSRETGEEGAGMTSSADDYHMQLHFGAVTAFGIPVSIDLSVAADGGTEVRGDVLATFGDIRVVDGELDDTYSTLDTLRMIARRHLQRERPDLEILGSPSGGFSNESGSISFECRQGDSPPFNLRVSLTMQAGRWRVVEIEE